MPVLVRRQAPIQSDCTPDDDSASFYPRERTSIRCDSKLQFRCLAALELRDPRLARQEVRQSFLESLEVGGLLMGGECVGVFVLLEEPERVLVRDVDGRPVVDRTGFFVGLFD